MSMPVDRIIGQAANADETLADSGFFWREKGGVKVLVSEALERAGFANGFSTRVGGVSPFPDRDLNLAGYDEDTAENIEENRRRFLSLFDRPYRLATVWQVHGDTIKAARTAEEAEKTEEYADAIISDLDGWLVGVKTADCVPVLIGDTRTMAFAAVHAGWRGTAASIVEKAIAALTDNFGTKAADLVAAIGPSAGCDRYEVGEDVMTAFGDAFSDGMNYFTATREGHALADIARANRDQLVRAGIPQENISLSPFCTMTRTDLFFSYRIEKKKYGKTGRLLSVIGRR